MTDPGSDATARAGVGVGVAQVVVATLALAMAFVILYTASPLFVALSDNATWRGLGWERGQTGALDALRTVVRQFNRWLIDPAIIRPFFVGAACAIAILTTRPFTPRTARGRAVALAIDLGLLALLAFALFVLGRKMGLGSDVLFLPNATDVLGAAAGVIVITELVRRLAGPLMFGLIVLAVAYMKWGAPEWLFYPTAPKSWDLLAMTFWLETSGAMGFALSIMLNSVVVFILFGVLIQATGASDAILKMSILTTRRLRGGPAHAAIASSAAFGTFSGSAAANVVGTGTFTIPLIKSHGFGPRFSAGIEAAASTGGQIMPPVMGAAAFYMAEQARVPYSQVAIAVILPALFYFLSLVIAVEIQARKLGLGAKPATGTASQRITRDDWVRSLAFFAPLATIIWCLAAGTSINRAGFWAVVATLAFGLLNPEFRARPWALFRAKAIEGGVAIGQLLAIVAGLGVFIGVVEGTGLGTKIGSDLNLLVSGNLLWALVLTMIASLILSMGMPTLPAYATIITIMGVFLVQLSDLGTPVLAVHLFVFYFGVLSPVTPPVALAAYAAAPIAGAPPFQTGLMALRLCFVAFVIPYAFFLHPQLLLGQVAFDPRLFLEAVVTLALSVWFLTTAMVGWSGRDLPMWDRALRTVAGILVLGTAAWVWVPAALAIVALGFNDWRLSRQPRVA
jgi:TRAP transporter 4TM/12TM fusion protein